LINKIGYNQFGDIGVSFIANGLQKNTSLKELFLCKINNNYYIIVDINIKSAGAIAIGESLKINNSLLYLNLGIFSNLNL